MTITMSPEARDLLVATRRAYIEAGPEGRCGAEHSGTGARGARRCVALRMGEVRRRLGLSQYRQFEIGMAWIGLCGKSMVYTNDWLGYSATVAVLDKLVTETAPEPSRHDHYWCLETGLCKICGAERVLA